MEKDKKSPNGVIPAETKQRYPRAVFFIIGNEFCERFSYYGMKTILTLYLTQILLYDDNAATTIYHAFSMACYFTPLFGAMLADSWLGKFKTIFYISILYAIGNVIISVGSIPHALHVMNIISLVGLGLIAIGTGGIKPCVSAFGGDQFEKGQELQLQQFFSFFYLAINLGSVISTFLTPILREDVKCFNSNTCFPLAFGIPAILMITSLVLFLLGKSQYKIVPPSGNIVVKVSKCICHALVQKSRAKEKKKEHWLYYAEDKYDQQFLKDIKGVLHVLLLYIPLPVFWALFDQQGSRWTLQATKMDGEIFGYNIKPDQMQVINPFLIIVFIPLFEYIIYPLFRKCHLLEKPLQRITIGGLLAASSFVIAGFLQLRIEQYMPVLPEPGYSEITLINNSPCNFSISEGLNDNLSKYQNKLITDLSLGEPQSWTFTTYDCGNIKQPLKLNFNASHPVESMMITTLNDQIKALQVEDSKKKPDRGEAKVRIFFNTKYTFVLNGTAAFVLKGKEKNYKLNPNVTQDSTYGITAYIHVLPGKYSIYLPISENITANSSIGEIAVRSGGSYVVSIYENPTDSSLVNVGLYIIVNPNSVHLLYQIPQYLIITAGEIMFSITGLEFSYSQAPVSMKSVLQAAWLLTVAFGNLIVVIIAKAELFSKQSLEFFMFACLMGLDMLIFAIMAYYYKYVNMPQSEETEDHPTKNEDHPTKNAGVPNKGFEQEEEDTKF